MSSNIYYDPEKFGLTIAKFADVGESYEFDMVVIWRRDSDGSHLIGHDSGCSCPMPFEDQGVNDLRQIHTLADVQQFASEAWKFELEHHPDNAAEQIAHLLGGLDLSGGAA